MTRSSKSLAGAGIFAAISASLCCIIPVLAMLAGITGIASSFSWLEQFRPYIIGITIFILGFAWFKALKPKKDDCACDDGMIVKKQGFINTKFFLVLITILAALLISFPYYVEIFFESKSKEVVITDTNNIVKVKLTIDGMTCQGCEEHVNKELSKVSGILNYKTSHKERNSMITFDKSKTDLDAIAKAINATGYTVSNYSVIKE